MRSSRATGLHLARAAAAVVPWTILGCGPADATGGASDGWADVAPIVERSCAPCHEPRGSAPFPLLAYDEVARRRREIAAVVESGFMPPWKPVAGYGRFQGEVRLSPTDRRRLLDWVAAGAPLGAKPGPAGPRELSPPAHPGGWRLGEPDAVLEMDDAFTVGADTFEEWRCFALPTSFDGPRFVRSIEVRPSSPRAMHHVLVYAGSAEGGTDDDGRPGLAGMCTDRARIDEMLGGWVPGILPHRFPEGVGVRLEPGDDLVVEAHFRGTGRPEEERTRVGLTFAEVPPDAPLRLLSFSAADIMLQPGLAGQRITDRVQIAEEVEVVAVLPHAHYVCHEVRAWAELPGGSEEPLIWIDDWDPDWQGFYRYVEPVRLPAGSWICTEFLFDNSAANPRNPHSPPRRVIGGSRSEDEMASLFLQVVPEDDAAAERIARSLEGRGAEEREVAGWWQYLVEAHDADGDGSLDAEEDAAATVFVETLWDAREAYLSVLDTDGNGRLDPAEEEHLRSAIRRWGVEEALQPVPGG